MKLALRVALASMALLAIPAQATVVVSSTGTIASTDPSQLGRLGRNGIQSTWAAPKAFPGTINSSTSYNYDLINGTFGANALQTVYYEITVTQLTGTDFDLFSVAYLNSFNPSSLGANYLGDPGSSLPIGTPDTYQVIVPVGGQLLVGIHNIIDVPAGYSYTIAAFSDPNRGENFLNGAVPEPSTWAMMLLGFVAVGFAIKRERKTAFA